MASNYYDLSMRALQLAGMSESTQEGYTRSVRQLVEFCGKTPDQITEQELQDYFLHRQNKDKWAPATLRISYSGIKFFFINALNTVGQQPLLSSSKAEEPPGLTIQAAQASRWQPSILRIFVFGSDRKGQSSPN